MKKLLAAASALALSLGLALVAVASPASAHTPTIAATCSSLSVSLADYAADAAHPESNTVAVVIDGSPATDPAVTPFATTYSHTWQLDPGKAHTYKVTVVAWDDYAYDVSKTGTIDPCITPAAPTFAEATCTTATGSYTIPETANVVYSVAGAPVTGTRSVAPGTSITITAAAAPGFALYGTSTWQHTFAAAPGSCGQLIAPLPPVVQPIVSCGTHGSLALTPVTGVVYTFTTGSAGQTEGPYVIVATPAPGYSFAAGASVTYSGTLGSYSECAPIATPPAVTAQSCVATEDSATLVSGSIQTFAQPGVTYTIHRTDAAGTDVTTAGGVAQLPPGTYTVTAHSALGAIAGRSVWSGLVIAPDLDCVELPSHALISGSVTATGQTCVGTSMRSGSLAFEQTPGAIVYRLNGAVVVADTLAVAPGTYTVTAEPASSDFQIDGPSSWTVTVTAFRGICGDLPTLALPGGDSGTLAYTGVDDGGIGFLGLTGAIMIACGILLLRTRRRA